MRTAEMCPVDGPWIFVRAGIGVWNPCREYEILARADIISYPAQLIPSVAVDAVDEHILPYRGVAVTVVVRGAGIIADVGDMEETCQGVPFHDFGDDFGQNQRTLAAEARLDSHACKVSEKT